MQTTPMMRAAVLLASAALLTACNGGDSPGAAAPGAPAQIKEETTQQVLAMAQTTSEVSEPLVVAPDAIAAAEIDDDTSYPLPVT